MIVRLAVAAFFAELCVVLIAGDANSTQPGIPPAMKSKESNMSIMPEPVYTTTDSSSTSTKNPPTKVSTTTVKPESTTSSQKPTKITSTVKPDTSTAKPDAPSNKPDTSTPGPSPSKPDRKFDAFSFLGGFALCLGLVAIGFLSWKFYISREASFYRTL